LNIFKYDVKKEIKSSPHKYGKYLQLKTVPAIILANAVVLIALVIVGFMIALGFDFLCKPPSR
jgi:hypothetical protein